MEPPSPLDSAAPPWRSQLLCETCGYGLFGLADDADGPECGRAVAASRPTHRTGPAWQNRRTARAWAATVWGVLRRPKRTFGTMRLEGPNLASRLFLLSIASVVGVGWGAFWMLTQSGGLLGGWTAGMVAAKVTLGMTYVEACGVTLFSWRRKWRVPFATAERVTCYASVGWVVAAAVGAVLVVVAGDGRAEAWTAALIGHWDADYRLFLVAVGFGAAVLGFEMLVWTGVRQVRFGNRPARKFHEAAVSAQAHRPHDP
ncbi:MAG: hypothetical protein AAFX76_06980 [Planctomycetota bacterium]